MSADGPGVIWLWEAGQASGIAGDREAAMAAAEPYLAAGTEGTAEEAVFAVAPAGDASLTFVHQRTGRAFRGRLQGGEPSWELVAGRDGGSLRPRSLPPGHGTFTRGSPREPG